MTQQLPEELWKEFSKELNKIKNFDISKIQLSPENNEKIDKFFKKFLDPKEDFPKGSRHSIVEKNFAIYIVKNKIPLETIKEAYKSKKFKINSLLSQIKGVSGGSYGEDPNVNIGELVNWCKKFRPDLIKTIKKDKLKSFLIEDRQKFESLGCGIHDDIFYFGTKLFKDGKPFSSIITSDKKVYVNTSKKNGKEWEGYNEILFNFGLKYKDDFYDEGLDNILSKEVVQKWIYEDCSEITIKSVYEKIIKILKKYIYLDDERKYSLLACYRIAGFFMPVWRARARLFLYAEMGSAKSRLTQIMHNTGFNSVSLGDWTLAYLQRLIESTRGETHIDDFETLDEDKKNATTRLVKTGFMKGFKAGKISDVGRRPETYDLFNTTTLNNTEGLDFISTDRCITIRIPKISKKEYDKEPNFEHKIWKEIRDNCYILGLKYSDKVKEIYDSLKSNKVRGRLFFIIKPELTIAKMISEKLYNDLENFWVEEIEQRETLDYETDWEFNAFKQIYKVLSTYSTNSTLSTHSTLSTSEYFTLLDDIVKPIGLEIYGEEEFKKKKRGMSIVVGNSLKRNPIFKKRVVKGKTQYKVNFEEFKSLLEAKNFLSKVVEWVESVESVESGMDIEKKVEVVKIK